MRFLSGKFRGNDRAERFDLDPSHTLSDGLQLFLGGNDAGASDAFDSSPFGRDGTLTSGPVWGPRSSRHGIEYDSDSNQYTSVNDAGLDTISGAMTWSYSRVVTTWDTTFNAPIMKGHINTAGGWGTLYSGNGTSVRQYRDNAFVSWTPDSTTGIRCSCVFTLDGTNATAYEHGIALGSAQALTSDGDTTTSDLLVGMSTTFYPFNGWLSDIAIWNRVLADDEIAILASDDPDYENWILPRVRRTYVAFGTAAPTGEAVGSAAGVGSATGVGSSVAASVATSAGTSTASAVGASLFNAAGSADGTSTASAVGASLTSTAGSSDGTSTASAGGQSIASAAGTSAGAATAAGVGQSTSAASGTAAGTSTAAAVGSSAFSTVGTAAGTSTAAATAASSGTTPAAGTSAGVATAVAVGRSTFSAVGSAAGVATVTGSTVDGVPGVYRRRLRGSFTISI